ncbi:MAG: PIN domain-containing protein [Candidatus Acidiferrales bacterium]
MAESKHRRHQRPQLRVVFDTNVLFTDSECYLVRLDVSNLINESKFPDLEIQWYLPEPVRHERHYQMQKKALVLMPHITKVERLLGHKLAITDEILLSNVEKVVSQRQQELNLLPLALDYNKVDWGRIALDAAYRRPPFEEGDKEKGFRDCLIAESFLQLVANSPRTPATCRIVLLSKDNLLTQAVNARTADSTNVRVVPTLEDLRGLINILVSEVNEDFLELIKPKADKLFCVPEDTSTLFYREHVREKLEAKFAKELSYLPPGATNRINGGWRIGFPNFVKKNGRCIQWTSNIGIAAEASKGGLSWTGVQPIPASEGLVRPIFGTAIQAVDDAVPLNLLARQNWDAYSGSITPTQTVVTHKGIDVYEVLWSVDVTTNRDLRRPSVDDIKHLDSSWEQVT